MTTNNAPNTQGPEDFIQVSVPRRLYAQVLRVLADGMAEAPPITQSDHPANQNAGKKESPWSAEEIHRLRPLIRNNPTAFKMMEMTCAKPGVRVSFTDVRVGIGRSHGDARADLASLTRIISHRLGRTTWPVHVENGPDGKVRYDASPEVATAWKSAGADEFEPF